MASEKDHARRVLVVAGDPGVRNSLCFMLEAEGFAVRAYPDAASVLADIPGLRADACVIDHHLPDMTGPELLMRMRARQLWAPTLFIAGSPSSFLQRAARALDTPIVPKPLTGDALLHALSLVFDDAPEGGARDA